MKIYIHYSQRASAGYVPRPALRLFNVAGVIDNGPGMVEVRMTFSDRNVTHDHVERVVIEPEVER